MVWACGVWFVFWCLEVFWWSRGLTRATPGPSTCIEYISTQKSTMLEGNLDSTAFIHKAEEEL
jgi:hypothetical protein